MPRQQNDSVSERRLRPIYDWLDIGNNKKALQEADKVLKKQPEFQCCRVLKSLALLRLGREEEASTILDNVLTESPVDESVLKAMTIGYRELKKPDKICAMYENASKKDPSNEEVLSHLFMSYVRLDEYKKQQITAMNLYKTKMKRPYYFWSVMSLVMQAQEGEEKMAQTVFLPLAHKMVEKMEKDGKIEQEQETMLYLLILEMKRDWKTVLGVLNGPLGARLDESASYHLHCMSKRLEMNEKLENWEEVARLSRNQIISQPDQWNAYNSYFTAVLKLAQTEGEKEDPSSYDLSLNRVDRSVVECEKLLDLMATGHPGVRSPRLGRLELYTRLQGVEEDRYLKLSGLVLDYVDTFGPKPVCFSDLNKYLPHIPSNQMQEFLQSLQTKHSVQQPSNIGDVCKDTCVEAIKRCCGVHDEMDLKAKVGMVLSLIEKYETSQPLVASLESTELRPSDNYLLLAAHILWDLWHSSGDNKYFSLGGALLQFGLKSSPSNWQLKLLLIRFCGAGGATSVCEEVHSSLDIKHLMLDTLGWILPRLLASTGQYDKVDRMYCSIVRLYSYYPKETIEYIIQAYILNNFYQIADIYQLKKRIVTSYSYTLVETQRLLLDLLVKPGSHDETVELMGYPEYSPLAQASNWRGMRDNRDLDTMVTWDPHTRRTTREQVEESFQSEKEFGHIRKLLLRTVCHTLHLADDIPEHFPMPDNNKPVTENGDGSSGAVLGRLVAELESLLSLSESKIASNPESVAVLSPTPQAPYSSRMLSYLPSHQLPVLLSLIKSVQGLHDQSCKSQNLDPSALTLFEQITNMLQLTQQKLEKEGGLLSSPSLVQRFFRFEILSHTLETFGLATILAGAVQSVLTSSKGGRKKKKKAVISPQLSSAVPSYLLLLQALHNFGDFVGKSIQDFETFLEEENLCDSLDTLQLTDKPDLSQELNEFNSRVRTSYKHQFSLMRSVLETKKKYLRTLSL